jgi:hypothetical protein
VNKYLTAFLLGLGSFFVFWGIGEYLSSGGAASPVGEAGGILILAGVLGGYFFACQYYLSRGNPEPVRNQWRLILSLNLVLTLFSLAVPLVVRKWIPTLTMLGLTAYSWACACAGAAVAARAARRQ